MCRRVQIEYINRKNALTPLKTESKRKIRGNWSINKNVTAVETHQVEKRNIFNCVLLQFTRRLVGRRMRVQLLAEQYSHGSLIQQ